MNVQVDHTSYNDMDYNLKGRFCSFWHQVNAAQKLGAKKVLEIGTGNGFVNFALKKSGMEVSVIDIDPNLQPDILGSVTEMPIEDNTFDTVLCCQVLEHIPYESFVPALKEIHRVVQRNVILSLPDLHRVYRFNVQLPGLGEIKFLYPIPRLKPLDWEFNGEHYWNISCKGYPVKRILADIESVGFKVAENFCVFELPWHRFFILKKG